MCIVCVIIVCICGVYCVYPLYSCAYLTLIVLTRCIYNIVPYIHSFTSIHPYSYTHLSLIHPPTHPTLLYPYSLPLLTLPPGIEAERALANCLSQNTRLKKISHSFRENFVAVYVDKYLQRNLDLVRQQRVQHTINTTDTNTTTGGNGEGGNKSNNSTPSKSGGGGGGEGNGSVYNSASSKSRSGSPGIKLPAYPFPSLQGSPWRRPTGT